MTSKNSYLNLSLTNFKRRIPYFVICFLVCFIMIPVVVYFHSEFYTGEWNYYDHKMVISYLMVDLVYSGYLQDAVTIVMAIMFAITGNAWNNSQKKNDFYRSLPIKENVRFAYIHMNSVLSFAISFSINMLLANIVIASFGLYESRFIVASFVSLLIHLLEFMSVYMVAVISQYLTGNMILAVCATFVLGGAEPAIKVILDSYKNMFYKTYNDASGRYMSMAESIYKNLTSPISGAVQSLHEVGMRSGDYYVVSNYSVIWPGVAKTVVQIVVYTAIAFFIYKRRNNQSGNKNIVFDKTKPFIKCLLMVPLALAATIIIIDNAGETMTPGLVAIVLSVFILHIVLQFLIEGDFAAVRRGFISTLVAGLLIVGTIGFYRFSGMRFDKYKPASENVESIGICTGNEYNYNFYNNDEFHNYLRSSQYFLNDVAITNPSYVAGVVGVINKDIENETYTYDEKWTKDTQYGRIEISFNMKNGKKIQKQYIIPYEDYMKIKYATYDQEEYRHASNQLEYENNRNYIENAQKLKITYYNYGFSSYDMCGIEGKELQSEMIEALSKDHNARTIDIYKNEIPVGYTELTVFTERGMDIDISMPMYLSDTNSIEVLKKLDYEPHNIDKNDITKVHICRYEDINDGPSEIVLTKEDDAFASIRDKIVLREGYQNGDVGVEANYMYEVTIFSQDGNGVGALLLDTANFNEIDKLMKSYR